MTIQVTVTWTHDGVGPPALFNVQRREKDTSWSQVGTVDYVEDITAYAFADNIPESNVRYRVNAENAHGVSGWLKSNIFAVKPGPVSGVMVAAV